MNVTIEDIADIIRRMTWEERAKLAAALTTCDQCGTKVIADHGDGGPCIRHEGHLPPHVDAAGNESLIAIRCRIGVGPRETPICSKIDGHKPPCAPIERKRVDPPPPAPAKLPDVPGFDPLGLPPPQTERGRRMLARRVESASLRTPGATDLRRSSARGHTYFVQAKSGGPIKIGFTKRDPKARARELEGPEEMVVLAVICGNVEKDTHYKLHASHLRREWFNPTPEVMAEVERARSGMQGA